MAKLYIANCTKQTQIIYYRLDVDRDGEADRVHLVHPPKKSPDIPAGRQIVVGGDLHINQIECIVDQLAKHGLMAEKEVGALTGVTPYIFNVDQPIKAEAIRTVLAHNSGVLIGQGRTRREAAAIGARQHVDTNVFEMSVEQETVSENDEARIEEGFRVVNTADEVPSGRGRGGGKSRRTA